MGEGAVMTLVKIGRAQTRNVEWDRSMVTSGLKLTPGMNICQTDLPIDFYQAEFQPYVEEYLALPNRTPEVVLPWMDKYVVKALDHFGDRLMLLAHYYMGGEIVQLVERYGGRIADSYELALQAVRKPETKIFVESAVHFMAETIAILKNSDQQVYITNPKSGCTMEALAKEDMVQPFFDELQDRYGDDLMVVCYMNTSGRLKAMAGRTGGAVCTSSNAHVIMRWAKDQGKKILFVPDEHLGRNSGRKVGITDDKMYLWAGGNEGAQQSIRHLSAANQARLDASELILWGSYCGVHMVFQTKHVEHFRARGYRVLVHPECTVDVVDAADGAGSTKYLWEALQRAKPGDKLAIGTEGHFVKNAQRYAKDHGFEVQNLADVPGVALGCGCATMSRNDPPHLVALLDLLRLGKAPALNLVEAGDAVEESTGHRERLSTSDQHTIAAEARVALERMIELTEQANRTA
jgi:quinolinate synthase